MTKIKNRHFYNCFIYFFMISLFYVSCSTDSNDSIDTETPSALINKEDKTEIEPTLLEIPPEFYDSAEEYVEKKLGAQSTTRDISGEDCIEIDEDGIAHLDPSCWVGSNIPDFGCDIVARGAIGCFPLAGYDNCSVCYIWVVLECDGKLFWYRTWILICYQVSGPYQHEFID